MKDRYELNRYCAPLSGKVFNVFLLILSLTLSQFTLASALQTGQSEVVSGEVTDAETGETIPGVNITIKGTTSGTTTDLNGNYQLTVPALNDTLVFSFVGYQTREIPINGRTIIDVSLQIGTLVGDEVVVVGYGTQTRRNLSGSISRISSDDVQTQGVITSVDQMLEGKVAGVQVVQNSGEPGGGISVDIRGVGSINAGSSPLYVIDGLPIDNSVLIEGTGNQVVQTRSHRNPLSSLNPSDIESIDILKDASATAIYGSRGANGVILITTKKGKPGDLQVNYSGSAGIQNVHQKLDMMNPEEYMAGINALIDAGEPGPSEIVTGIQGEGTDWQDVVFRDNAMIQTHNLTFSGGGSNSTYLIALNNANQDGIVKETSYERYGVRLNLNYNTDRLNMGFSGNLSYIKDNFVPYGFDIALRGGIINATKASDPTLPVRDASGDFVTSDFMTLDNPLAIITGSHVTGNRYQYFGTFYSEYFVLPNLAVKVNLGGDVKNDDKNVYKDRTTLIGNALGGVASAYEAGQSNYLIEGTVSFQDEIANGHEIDAVAGITTQRFIRQNSEMHGTGFVTDATGGFNFSLADRSTLDARSYKSANQLLSYLGRVNYAFNDKYVLTASYRVDGSSRFGEGNRFGYFPSVSAGWLIDQEEFFTPMRDVVNLLKLRASWGKTGNQSIGNYTSLTTFASINPDIYTGDRQDYVLDGQLVKTLNPLRLPNPDLKWETTTQLNFGLDVNLLEDRISGSVEWYHKDTEDMLVDLPIPSESGYSSRLSNIGSMRNEGFEFALSSTNVNTSDFTWSSDVNFSTLKNEVTDIGDIDNIITGSMTSEHNNISIITPGLPARSFYGYEVIGIWQEGDDFSAVSNNNTPGQFKFRDVNGDGVIDSEDRVDLGNSFPDFTWGFGNTINYKSFNLHFFFQGVSGIKMLNGNLLETYWPRGGATRANRLAGPFLNRWTSQNPTNDEPSFVNLNAQSGQSINSKTVVDASYIKLQTVRLSYNLPVELLNGIARSAEIYVTGQNLLTISDYNGFDPALNPNGSANFRLDWNGYPSVRTYLVGLNINF